MKIIVIGSEGNIGTKLVAYLQKCGHDILRSDIIQHYAKDYVQTDIISLLDLYDAAYKFKPEVIYHLAAMVSRVTCEATPHLTIDTNLSGTNNVAQLCKTVGAKMINFSTSEIYGNLSGLMSEDRVDIAPNNRYGLTKLLAEKIVEYEVNNHGLKAAIVRPFMFYDEAETMGDHRSAMIRFAEGLLNKKKIHVHKNSKRAWLHMDDAVVALEKFINLDKFYAINIGHPKVIETEYIARYMCDKIGVEFEKYVELDVLPERMTLEKYPDLTRQKELLDFEPKISIERGIERVINKVKSRLMFDTRSHSIYDNSN
jgi:nucleoside-diphosphate-sugar epimerase